MMHLLVDILRNSILITGLVVVMMMMIESFNIESKGLVLKGLRKTKVGQVVFGALLGSIPGCMGGFATVSLYTHRMMSFGALVAMMIASSGDESFVMLAMIPEQALILFIVLFIIAIMTGIITDQVYDKVHKSYCDKQEHDDCISVPECSEGFLVHEETEHNHKITRHYGWKRIVMLLGLAVFIAALASGQLGHDHSAHTGDGHSGHVHTEACEHGHIHTENCAHAHDHHEAKGSFHIDLLSEDWMNILFAGLSIIVLAVLLLGSDHFVEEHFWNHIVRKHLPSIFGWTFGVLLFLGVALQYIDIDRWISDNTVLMILLATAIGIIPESGPHMIFVTLFAAGAVPFPVLLASSISQDGHASIPLLAESKKSFAVAKLINCVVALAAGYAAMLFM
jgi:hypothetical protein